MASIPATILVSTVHLGSCIPLSSNMDVDDRTHTSKHKRSRDKGDRDHKKKRHKSDKDSSKRKSKDAHKTRIVDDDADEDMWMEKNIDMDGETVRA